MEFCTPNSKALTKKSIASRMSVDCFEPSSIATTGSALWMILENLTESLDNGEVVKIIDARNRFT